MSRSLIQRLSSIWRFKLKLKEGSKCGTSLCVALSLIYRQDNCSPTPVFVFKFLSSESFESAFGCRGKGGRESMWPEEEKWKLCVYSELIILFPSSLSLLSTCPYLSLSLSLQSRRIYKGMADGLPTVSRESLSEESVFDLRLVSHSRIGS
jgi:hypothetical protein